MSDSSYSTFISRLYEQLPGLYRAMLHHEANALASGEIDLPQSWALEALESGPMNMRALCSLLRLKSSTGTAFVDRLNRKGFVRRLRETHDRRSVRVQLTPAGRRAARALRAKKQRGMRMLFAPLSAEDRRVYLDLIGKLVAGIRDAGIKRKG